MVISEVTIMRYISFLGVMVYGNCKERKSAGRERDLHKEFAILKKKAKDYIIITLISHGIGLAVFTPYNLAVLNFTTDLLIRNAIASTGIAFVWNCLGYRLTATCSQRILKRMKIFGH
jgi:uncharacterized protein (DUF486 family)